jgi:hypothetical protein
MPDIDIEIGKIYFPNLPKDHPLRKYCEERKHDMKEQDATCKMVSACFDELLAGLITKRTEADFKEVADARKSSFEGSVLTDDGDALLLSTDATEPADAPTLVGPSGDEL